MRPRRRPRAGNFPGPDSRGISNQRGRRLAVGTCSPAHRRPLRPRLAVFSRLRRRPDRIGRTADAPRTRIPGNRFAARITSFRRDDDSRPEKRSSRSSQRRRRRSRRAGHHRPAHHRAPTRLHRSLARGFKLSWIPIREKSSSRRSCAGNPQSPRKISIHEYAAPARRTLCGAPYDQRGQLTLRLRRHISLRQFGAFPEKKLLHLFFHDLLRVGIKRIQPVFVHHHLGVLQPQLPRLFRNAFVHALANLSPPGDTIQSRQILVELDAVHHPRARLDWFARRGCRIARFVRHSVLLAKTALFHLTATPRKFLAARLLPASWSRPGPSHFESGNYLQQSSPKSVL